MQNYKDLKVWQKGHEFTLAVYASTKLFPKEELYCLTTQLRRCAFSIRANIAEGAGKNSQLDFAKYLNIALGSANESEYYLLLAKDLSYLQMELYKTLTRLINEIKAMLTALITKVRNTV